MSLILVTQNQPVAVKRPQGITVTFSNLGVAAGGVNADVFLSQDRAELAASLPGTQPRGLPLLTNQTPKAQIQWVNFPGRIWLRAQQNDTDQIEVLP